MTFPAVQPGVIAPPMDTAEKRVKKLERRQDSQANKDLSNAIVGQGSSFRATVVDGGSNVMELSKGLPVYGNKQVMKMRDLGGKLVYQHDEVAGYGLSAPLYGYPMYTIPGVSSTAGIEAEFARSEAFVYNAVWYVKVLIRNMTGAATSWSIAVKVSAPSLPDVISSPITFTGGAAYFQRFLLLPIAYMNVQSAIAQVLATPNGTGAIEVWPVVSAGRYKAYWDYNPGLR